MNKNIINWKVILFSLVIFTFVTISVSGENEASGFTVASISSSIPISNNKDLDNATITMTIIARGGQKAVGNFGNTTFSKIIPNIIMPYPLVIELGSIQEILTYPIVNQGGLYAFKTKNIDATVWWDGAKCDNSTFCFPTDTDRFGVGPDRIVAINRPQEGVYGIIGNPDLSWKGKMKVTVHGIPYTKTIGSNIGSVNFRTLTDEFILNAKWGGNLVTGQSVPSPQPYVATYTENNGAWRISPLTNFIEYTKSLSETDITFNNQKTEKYGYWKDNNFYYTCTDPTCSFALNCVNIHNANYKILTNANVQIGYNSMMENPSDISTKKMNGVLSGNIIHVTDVNIANPVITLIIAAKELHAYIPVGIPEIQSITTESSNSGDGYSHVYVKIKNVGTSKGTFSAYLEENDDMFTSQNVESAKCTIEIGDTCIIALYINTGLTPKDLDGNIVVYDVNNPSKNVISKGFQLSILEPKMCTPNIHRLYSNKVYKCSEDGTYEIEVLDCTNNLIKYIDDRYICEDAKGNTNSNFDEETKQTSTTNNKKEKEEKRDGILLPILYWIIYFLGLSSLFMIANKIRNSETKITKENMDKSMTLAGIIIGLFYIYIQFVALSEKLGSLMFIIISFITIIILIINGISFIQTTKILPIKYSIILCIIMFIILTYIMSGLKDVACDWLPSWIIGNCKEFSITNYLFGNK